VKGTRLTARLRRYFISGFFTAVPIGLSALSVWWFIRFVDSSLAPIAEGVVGRSIPGFGILVALLAILAAGALASHVVGGKLVGVVEDALLHVPVFKWVYGTIKRMTEAFSPENKTAFKSVVIVEYPRPGVYSLGFVTSETSFGDKELMAVYVPTNHIYVGDVILVPKAHVFPTTMNIQQGIQSVLSAGATLPEKIERRHS
jgi:PGF-CTERM protein